LIWNSPSITSIPHLRLPVKFRLSPRFLGLVHGLPFCMLACWRSVKHTVLRMPHGAGQLDRVPQPAIVGSKPSIRLKATLSTAIHEPVPKISTGKSFREVRKALQILSQVPSNCYWSSRRQQVTELPYRFGRSFHRSQHRLGKFPLASLRSVPIPSPRSRRLYPQLTPSLPFETTCRRLAPYSPQGGSQKAIRILLKLPRYSACWQSKGAIAYLGSEGYLLDLWAFANVLGVFD
jgi:hypothetical protein